MNRLQLPVRIFSCIAITFTLCGCGETNTSTRADHEQTPTGGNSTNSPEVDEPVEISTKAPPAESNGSSPLFPKENREGESEAKMHYASLEVSALQAGAEQGDATACHLLGLRHEWGYGVPADAMAAYRWVALAASRSKGIKRILSLKDLARLAAPLTETQIEQSGQPAKEFWQQKLADLQKRAEEEDPRAQFELGLIYYTGDGFGATERTAQLAKHLEKARELFNQASGKGHAGATALLATMLTSVNTASYTRPGELKRFADAKKSEGLLEAYRLFHLVSSEKNSRALVDILELSKHMTPGELAEVDDDARNLLEDKAALLTAAAEMGDGKPQLRLGLMLYLGKEIPKDLQASAEWLRKSGENHHAEASALLAAMYFTGEGVEKDFPQVYKWYGISQAQGNATAAAHKAEVAKLLTAEEKATADEDVKAWLKAHPKKEPE